MRRRYYFTHFLLAIVGATLLLLGSWLPLAGHTPTASAHSFVIGSDPVDGSTVSKAPSVVRIFFDAPISAASQAKVYAFPPGTTATGVLVNASSSSINTTNPRELDTALLPASKLPLGGYEVRWTALSLTDGHTTSGLIGFNIGQSSTGFNGVPTLGPSTSNYFPQLNIQGILAVAWDWLILAALCFWVGTLVTEHCIVSRTASATVLSQVRKHSGSLQVLCLVTLLAGEIISLALRTTTFNATLTGSALNLAGLNQLVLHTTYGWLWLTRIGLLTLALLLLGWQTYRERPRQPSTTVHTSTVIRRFKQLRQQVQQATTQETPAKAPSTSPPTRGTTAALPKATEPIDAPAHTPAIWQIYVEFALAALVLLTLVLSNEITQLVVLPISAGIMAWLGLVAQGIWFGCIAYLGLVLLPLLPNADPDHHAETLVRTLKCALPWLLSALGMLLVSDLFLGEATIHTPAQLLNDSYGRAFLVRGLLLLLMLIFTSYMLFFLLPRLQRQTVLLPVVDAEMPARRTRTFALARTESIIQRALHTLSGLAAATLICVALMQFFAPPVVFPNINYAALVNQASTTGNPAPPTSQTQHVGDLTATLQVLPDRAGVTNTVQLTLSNAQGQAITGATVKLSINMEIMNMGTISTTAQGNHAVYTASFPANRAFSMPGPWILQVEIDRPSQQPVNATFQVVITQ